MGVNKDNGVRTGSMTGGSSQIKVIEAAGTAVRYRWQTGVIAVQADVAGTWWISKTLNNGIVRDGGISSGGWCMYTLT